MQRGAVCVVMLCSLSFVGAKSCFDDYGNMWSSQRQGSPLPPPPYCRTDPPLGCVGVCLTGAAAEMLPPGTPPGTTPDCAAGADLAALFVADVQTQLECDQTMEPYVVFPPYFGIAPQVVETGDGCATPPPLPAAMPLSAFTGDAP